MASSTYENSSLFLRTLTLSSPGGFKDGTPGKGLSMGNLPFLASIMEDLSTVLVVLDDDSTTSYSIERWGDDGGARGGVLIIRGRGRGSERERGEKFAGGRGQAGSSLSWLRSLVIFPSRIERRSLRLLEMPVPPVS